MPRFVYATALMLLQQGVVDADSKEEAQTLLEQRLTRDSGEWDLEKFKTTEATMQIVEVTPVVEESISISAA